MPQLLKYPRNRRVSDSFFGYLPGSSGFWQVRLRKIKGNSNLASVNRHQAATVSVRAHVFRKLFSPFLRPHVVLAYRSHNLLDCCPSAQKGQETIHTCTGCDSVARCFEASDAPIRVRVLY